MRGRANREMAVEGSRRAVDHWSGVIPRCRRGRGFLARGPPAADGRRARRLGLAGRQCLAQCDQRRAAHRRVRLHSAEAGESSQDLYADGPWRFQSLPGLCMSSTTTTQARSPSGATGGFGGLIAPLLISHVVLAALIVPFALTTIYRAWRGEFARHRRIARWTLPVWLYVSVTGVLVYWMLYHLGP